MVCSLIAWLNSLWWTTWERETDCVRVLICMCVCVFFFLCVWHSIVFSHTIHGISSIYVWERKMWKALNTNWLKKKESQNCWRLRLEVSQKVFSKGVNHIFSSFDAITFSNAFKQKVFRYFVTCFYLFILLLWYYFASIVWERERERRWFAAAFWEESSSNLLVT